MSDFEEIFGGGFDAQAEAAAAANEVHEYQPLEPGWYKMMIEAPKDGQMIRDTKAGGKLLKLVLRGAPGEAYEKRLVFWNINLIVKPKENTEECRNKAAKAEQIGRRELAKLCVAVGKPQAKDSAELIDCAVLAHVVIGKDAKGQPDNEIKDVKPIGSDVPAAPAPKKSAPAAAPAAEASSGSLPWQK